MESSDKERWRFPAAVFLAAAVILLPQLGGYGLWDPQEIAVADQARQAGGAAKIAKTQPPLTVWLISASTGVLGPSETAARLPVALLGILGALALYALGARLANRRTGSIAALILLASPMYIFQSRQLMSDVATITFSIVAMVGLVGLIRRDKPWVDAPIAIAGLVLAQLSDGMLLGPWIPL